MNITDALVGIMLLEETRIEINEDDHNVLGFPSKRLDPYSLHYEQRYEGNSKPAQFVQMYAHVISKIRQYNSEFCVDEDDGFRI
ncbi:hypothetical protein BVRB_030010 [Beta vulgaris subsp. vulgaris]|uniref:Uncharacterized protein n=1 Tax=Beta vulgaris subsp. vulgaris TaxID=3555 RepID=A0A0J8B0Z1_BETVV|nr:hypothetical protein BVRB_030010 [Beta vulgaris subsp. vulgaris]